MNRITFFTGCHKNHRQDPSRWS